MISQLRMNYRYRSFLLCFLLMIMGCSKPVSNRHDVWGTVQWKGKPVPSGIILILPDVKKGNRGAQGFAFIKDGKFDTRSDNGKGGVAGAALITVDGTDGKPVAPYQYGKPLFGAEKPVISAEIKPGGMELNLTVPDNASVAMPTNIEPLN